MTKMNRYFIAFIVNTTEKSGFGTIGITANKPINSIEDILEISRLIEKRSNLPAKSVMVTNYQLLPEEENNSGETLKICFTEDEIDKILSAIISSCVDIPNDLQDRVLKALKNYLEKQNK